MNIQDLYSLRTVCRQQLQKYARVKNGLLSDEEADRFFLDVDNAIGVEHNPMLALDAATTLVWVHLDQRDNFLVALRNCSTIEAVDALIDKVLYSRQDFIR